MTSQIIKPNRVALYLDSPELRDLGIASENPDSCALHSLVLGAFETSGLKPRGGMEIEIFHGCDGLMIFAEFGTPLKTEIFAFDDFENLISSLTDLSFIPGFSKLTYFDGTYYLEIRDLVRRLNNPAAMLSEFGTPVSPDLSSFYTEHGKCLITPNAIGELLSIFF